jgi:trehalose-6-phosphate synthase
MAYYDSWGGEIQPTEEYTVKSGSYPDGGYGYTYPSSTLGVVPEKTLGNKYKAPETKAGVTRSSSGSTGVKTAAKTNVRQTQYLNIGSTATSEQRTDYEGEAPEYEKFEYDKGRIEALAQQFGGRYTRKAREGLLQAITGINTSSVENPIARAQMYRQAMAGYSEGLSGGMAEASRAAIGAYGQEYSAEAGQHKLKHESDVRSFERTGIQRGTQTRENKFAPGYTMNPLWNAEEKRMDQPEIDKSNWTDFQKGNRTFKY